MNNSINLVSSRNDAIERERKVFLSLRIIAIVLLSTIAVGSILAFIITTTIPLSKIKDEQTQTLASISTSSKKLSSYYLIRDKLTNINSLTTTRADYIKPIELIFSKLPEGVSIDSLDIERNLIEIEISGSSLLPLDEAIKSLVALGTEGKIIKSVKLKSLNLNAQAARYSVTFAAEKI
ncbi:MAG: hypothetical protein A3B38_01150 [Candidatus Levybacteria bacterium RIFCSPLOWO2_01_FULL_36_13]|nr:MAG: hypothetical protein A2684_02390 [Candidatus Levybacteria bacterium RIFCSPHIGHO2_01_FULL_36_15b]OGH35493.1 MAG: hypothetical protein A3B38_01150 [Candidatus Levybacteria bacterium RIFCSPLOWO2_01_FULL_36_13]